MTPPGGRWPGRWQGGHGDRRLGDALSAFLADQGWGAVGALAAVHRCWDEVAGAEVASHAQPLALRDGVLVLGVDEPTWAAQLPFLAPTLLERLAAALGEAAPQRLEARLRRPGRGGGASARF